MSTKQLATTADKSLQEIPEGGVFPGLENVEQDMLIIPRIKLVQSISAEVMENDTKPGSFVNSVLKDVIAESKGKDGAALKFIPVDFSGRTRILFKDLDDGGGILCRSENFYKGIGTPGGICCKDEKNPVCKHAQWTDTAEKRMSPECTAFYNFFVMVAGYSSIVPLVLSFSKSNYPIGRKLINLLKFSNTFLWNSLYELKSKYKEDGEFKYFAMDVVPSGKPSEEETDAAKKFHYMLKSMEVVITDEEVLEREASEKVQAKEEAGF